jgi:predicted AlkP superfamily pyrophosphatase or phosphodiesterase
MVTRIRWLLPLVVAAAAVLGATTYLKNTGGSPVPGRTVIVISLDGTTPDDLRDPELSTLGELMRRGSSASRLVPVFPTNTFPNHVSLVTGVSPAVHGIVNNSFVDPERGRFRYENDPTWIQVEPLWAIAEGHGVVSAAYHWIGSEGAWRNGRGPRHWRKFDSQTRDSAKIEQILDWLDSEDPAERPRLITSWFPGADHAGHRFGPGSPEARSALRRQDRALADLVTGLDERGAFATTTLLVVSDHGMLAVREHVDLNAALREAGLRASALGGGGFATVSFDAAGAGNSTDLAALARRLGLAAHPPNALPDGVSVQNPRFGDAVILAPVGTAISIGSLPPMLGAHGYLPDVPEMGAVLIAAGAGIAPGRRLGEVRTIDVAPTLLTWLGISPPDWMEGRPIPGLVTGRPDAATTNTPANENATNGNATNENGEQR